MFEVLVATVIVKDNKVLMVKETKEEVKGLLNLPAGHLEKNETLIEGGLAKFFNDIFISEKVGFAKPDVRLFEHIFKQIPKILYN